MKKFLAIVLAAATIGMGAAGMAGCKDNLKPIVEREDKNIVVGVTNYKPMDYIENGNITNSVNSPACHMGACRGANRLALFHKNIPNIIAQITNAITELNISDMMNKSRGDYAYTLMDLDSPVTGETIEKLNKIKGLIRFRVI